MTEQLEQPPPPTGPEAERVAVPPAEPKVLVAHDGGPRAGHVSAVPKHLLASYLVYDGPQWLGVYQRSSPVRIARTERGDAEVWTALG